MIRRWLVTLTALFTAAACGAAAGDGGGDTDLPTRAAGPYGPLEADPETEVDEPVILADPDEVESWRAPWVREDGDGRYVIYFAADRAGRTTIRRAVDVDLADGPGSITEVLAADATWEASRVDHPQLTKPGFEHAWGLLYEGGDGAIGYAGSDDGEFFHKAADNPLLEATLPEEGARVGQPAAAWLGDTLFLYYAAPDVGAIFLATVTFDGGAVVEKVDADPSTPEHDPVLGPSPFSEYFDTGAVSAPTVRITRWADRPVFDLWYAGRGGGGEWTIGFAGSHDGWFFKRFEENPSLPTGGAEELDPSVVPYGIGALMFYTRVKGDDPAGIAAAIH